MSPNKPNKQHAGRTLKDPLPGPTENPFEPEAKAEVSQGLKRSLEVIAGLETPPILRRRPQSPQWEYKSVQPVHVDLLRILNEQGLEGWEVIGPVAGLGILMKRPLVLDAGA